MSSDYFLDVGRVQLVIPSPAQNLEFSLRQNSTSWLGQGLYPDILNNRKEEKIMSKEKKGNREAKKVKANPKAGKKLKKDPKRHDGVM